MHKDVANYIRIAEDIKRKILNGFYYEGDPLPSQRVLAKEYEVSRFTISQAIEVLYSYGYVSPPPTGKKMIAVKLSKLFPDWQGIVERGHTPSKAWLVRKAQNMQSLWPKAMPGISQDFGAEELILPALEKVGKRLFEPNNYEKLYTDGLPSLKDAYLKYLSKRGISACNNELLITSGVESAISILAQCLCSNKLNLIMATPTVYTSVAIFKQTGINIIQVPMDNEGIIPEELLKHSKRFNNSILYLEPSSIEPTGVCTSLKRRKELVNIIKDTKMAVIENDQRYELWEDAVNCPTFKELLPDQVIYIDGSLKVLFPNTQIACIVTSNFLVFRLTDMKVQLEHYTSSINQLLAEELLISDKLDDFFTRIRSELGRRKDYTDTLLHKYLEGEAEWLKPVAGLFFWIKLKNVNSHNLCKRVANHPEFKSRIISSLLYMDNDIRHLQFCYSNVNMDQLEKSIQIIAEEVKLLKRSEQ